MLTACRVVNAGPISARGSDGGPDDRGACNVGGEAWATGEWRGTNGQWLVVSECEAG